MSSDAGEVIIERLGATCGLKKDIPARNVILHTIGTWFDEHNVADFLSNTFLSEANGKWLDVIGVDYNVPRKLNEADEDYRQRIIYERLGHLTFNYLVDIYNIGVYVYRADFNINDNTLTSDNPYYNSQGFMLVTDEDTKSILEKKFILDSDVTWQIQ